MKTAGDGGRRHAAGRASTGDTAWLLPAMLLLAVACLPRLSGPPAGRSSPAVTWSSPCITLGYVVFSRLITEADLDRGARGEAARFFPF